MAKIVLAMSGGVDSSVAAALLLREGHSVTGLFMRHDNAVENPCFSEDSTAVNTCSSPRDEADARAVAEKLGIPLTVMNFHDEFQQIKQYFVREYVCGRTPNPCVMCNAKIKFGKIVDFADRVGAEFVATGHYARVEAAETGDFHLCTGLDATKDQSYVLFGIRRELLPRLKFPLGTFRKSEIREIAAEIGLTVAKKRDSQEICFVPDKDHAKFVRDYVSRQKMAFSSESATNEDPQDVIFRDTAGKFVLTDGTVVGAHVGIEKYTIGQRKGLGLAFGEPRYVVRLERETNRVVLGTHEDLARTKLVAGGANWLIPEAEIKPGAAFTCEVKIRYSTPALLAMVTPRENGTFLVEFHAPFFGIAPGQAAVCYRGPRLLGGGWIQE